MKLLQGETMTSNDEIPGNCKWAPFNFGQQNRRGAVKMEKMTRFARHKTRLHKYQ